MNETVNTEINKDRVSVDISCLRPELGYLGVKPEGKRSGLEQSVLGDGDYKRVL